MCAVLANVFIFYLSIEYDLGQNEMHPVSHTLKFYPKT